MKLHNIIDKLNPLLRTIENINGKERKRKFYAMSAEEAYNILDAIAQINGLEENLISCDKKNKKWKKILPRKLNNIQKICLQRIILLLLTFMKN